MITTENTNRLNAIVEGASKLSAEHQEYILSTIRGMLFTRALLEKGENKREENSQNHSRRNVL